MPGFIGRAITLAWGDDSPAEQVDGIREKGVSLNGEAIDVSDDDSAGWRELLTVAGQNEVNISVSGVTKSDTLKEAWFSGNRTRDALLTYPDGGTIAGVFFLASYTDTGPYNDATTFEAELQSSGAVVYTPAS